MPTKDWIRSSQTLWLIQLGYVQKSSSTTMMNFFRYWTWVGYLFSFVMLSIYLVPYVIYMHLFNSLCYIYVLFSSSHYLSHQNTHGNIHSYENVNSPINVIIPWKVTLITCRCQCRSYYSHSILQLSCTFPIQPNQWWWT